MAFDQVSALTPTLIPRARHSISRDRISENALRVLYRLRDAGFAAYLVGGGVRDLLLGHAPKDFDVVTDAHPEQVRGLFRNCRLIGRRFRLAHVYFGRDIVEVATFRAPFDPAEQTDCLNEHGRIMRDNVYGTLEEDVLRRDFTVNALYYNIRDFSLVDYTGAMADLQARILRPIGNSETRFHEDPVRMLRAVRFAAKLDFAIEHQAEESLYRLGHLLSDVPPARLFDEVLKLFHGGFAVRAFELLHRYGLFQYLFPQTETMLQEAADPALIFIRQALANTDARILEGKPVTPAFLCAVLLWPPARVRVDQLTTQGMPRAQALALAGQAVTLEQVRHTALPKRFSLPMREIWELQARLTQRTGVRALRLLADPRFRAAYDFLCLRAASGEAVGDLCQWWTQLQAVPPEEQARLTMTPTRTGRRKRARRLALHTAP